jgi:hypothetical protein
LVRHLAASACLLWAACLQAQPGLPVIQRFELQEGGRLEYFSLPPSSFENGRDAPPRYRAYVIPGSGCRGLAPIAANYFRGLRQGEVVVVHKQHVDASLWPGPTPCSVEFNRHDSLSNWARDASQFVGWHLATFPTNAASTPLVLVGISEGAELLPWLVRRHPAIGHVVMVGSTGLDPWEAMALQAQRLGAPGFMSELQARLEEPSLKDTDPLAERSVGYWRSLSIWPFSEPLLALDRPLWMGFGEKDASVPLDGLVRFVQRAQARGKTLCVAVFTKADHGLQAAGQDRLQTFWSWIDAAVTQGQPAGDCSPLAAPNSITPLP